MIYQSEELLRRNVVMSGLVATVDAELKRQGKDWAWLSRETDFAESTFTKWKKQPDLVPNLYTLALIASKLQMPLRILIEACGFPVDDTAGYANRQARARALIAALPQLAEVAEDLARLKPDDQVSLLVFIEGWVRDLKRRRQNRKGQKGSS